MLPGSATVSRQASRALYQHRQNPYSWHCLGKNIGFKPIDLYKTVLKHRRMLEETHKLDQVRRERKVDEFRNVLINMIRTQTDLMVRDNSRLAALAKLVEDGALDPYTAAENALNQIKIFDTSLD